MINKLSLTNKRVLPFAVYICIWMLYRNFLHKSHSWSSLVHSGWCTVAKFIFYLYLCHYGSKVCEIWLNKMSICCQYLKNVPLCADFSKMGNCHFWLWFEREFHKKYQTFQWRRLIINWVIKKALSSKNLMKSILFWNSWVLFFVVEK